MPMRAAVGSPDGVTKASIAPDTAKHADQSQRDDGRRPAGLGQRLRARTRTGRDPGPAGAQAHSAGHEHGGQFEHAVGQDQAEEHARLAGAEHGPADDADVDDVLPEHVQHADHGHPEEQAERR